MNKLIILLLSILTIIFGIFAVYFMFTNIPFSFSASAGLYIMYILATLFVGFLTIIGGILAIKNEISNHKD